MSDLTAIEWADDIWLAAYVETYGSNSGSRIANMPDPLHDALALRISQALSKTGDDGMLIKIEETGDYVQTNAWHAVMRVQKNEDKTALRVVTLDGGHLRVPAPASDDGSVDQDVLQALCDKVARVIDTYGPPDYNVASDSAP